LATSHAELREAAEKVASAMQAVGLDRWPRFLADAQERARDPATVAAIEKSGQPADPGRDAIRPVYPLETLLGIGAAGIAGGAAAVARAAGGAILKQILPGRRSPPGNAAVNAAKPGNAAGNVGEQAEATIPSLPAKPDDLLAQGWKETSHPGEAVSGRRVFVDPGTGQTVEFDKGRPGQPGWRGRDHYHIRNLDAAGKGDKYLDRDGRPVPDGSKQSHLPPDQ
jgi:hypothetical protein